MKRKTTIRFDALLLLLILFSSIIFESVFGLLYAQSIKKNEFYPGDALRITFIDIYKNENRSAIDISGIYTIDSRGFIMLPIKGKIKVIGLNRITLAEKIIDEFKEYFTDPYIEITPLIRVTLMGPFYKPGSYRISQESSLWELIDLAGGPRENCNLNSIKIVRGDKDVKKNLLLSFEKGFTLEEIGVQSGDQIVAKAKREFGIRQVFDYLRFAMSIISLYLLYERYNR